MASGDAVVQVLALLPPAANPATVDVRPGGSTPGENVLVHDFDAATIEFLDFLCKLEGYGGNGTTWTLPWSASTATGSETVWGIAVRRMEDDAEDIDGAHTYVFTEDRTGDTAASASGELSYPTIALADGAEMDNWAEGELAIVRVRRNATAVSVAFTSGSEQPSVGDTMDGATSGASAVVVSVELTSGTFGGGDAAGNIFMNAQSGTFQSENLDINGGTSNVMTIGSDTTVEDGMSGDAELWALLGLET